MQSATSKGHTLDVIEEGTTPDLGEEHIARDNDNDGPDMGRRSRYTCNCIMTVLWMGMEHTNR